MLCGVFVYGYVFCMVITGEQTVLVTGASGGLGAFITRALAARGVKLALVAYPGVDLDALCQEVRKKGGKAISIIADLRLPAERKSMLEKVRAEFGHIDILVNNAGVEFTAMYHELSEANILEVLGVNLEAPMMLTQAVLPDMLRRRSGHIVNISSLAGKTGPAFQEPYAATKAGLIAFTSSLRGTYRGTGVSASVICPGFVEAGIYSKLKAESGISAPFLLAACQPESVAEAVVRAIENNLPEVIVSRYPFKPLCAMIALFPRFGEFLLRQTGAHEFFSKVADALKKKHASR